jgi:hypothetical protein
MREKQIETEKEGLKNTRGYADAQVHHSFSYMYACVNCNTAYLFTKRINECQEITTVGLAFGDFCPSSVP